MSEALYSDRNLIPFKITIARNIPNVAYMWRKRTTWKGPIIYLRAPRKDRSIFRICSSPSLLGNPDTCTEYNDPSTLLCGQQFQLNKIKGLL